MIIQVRNVGNDGFSRPTLQNIKTGHIYSDINLGLGTPDWHILTTEGEPLARIGKEVVFEVIDEPEHDEDHITFFNGDGERIDCTTVDSDASDRSIWNLFAEFGHKRTPDIRFQREPHTGEC